MPLSGDGPEDFAGSGEVAEMKCEHIRNMMGAYLYGDLAPAEMREVRLHIRECPQCREDLAERGRVISLISDDVPQLTDEEKDRMAWTVKGAVRFGNRTHSTIGLRFRLVRPLAVGAVLAAGLAVGILVSTHVIRIPLIDMPGASVITSKKSETVRDESQTLPRGIVKITEEETVPMRKEADRPGNSAERSATKQKYMSPVDRFAAMVRRGATFGTAARNNPKPAHEKPLSHEGPVTLASPDDTPKIEHPEKNLKLPEPTDLNNAQTSSDNTSDR